MIIAIDGPAASGKGTIAKQIAGVYGLPHLDTGLIYRAVAHRLHRQALFTIHAEKPCRKSLKPCKCCSGHARL